MLSKPIYRGLLVVLSLGLSAFILIGTSYASLNDWIQTSSQWKEEFLNFSNRAQASGRGGSSSSSSASVGRAHSYATSRIKIYEIPPNTLQVFGFAPNSTQGIFAAQFQKDATFITTNPKGTRLSVGNSGWYVIVYYLGLNDLNRQVFQVNLYDHGGVLQDDSYRFDRDDPTKTR